MVSWLHLSLTFGSALALPASDIPPNNPGGVDQYPSRCYPDPCAGITFNQSQAEYVCGDMRLGPVQLPTNFPLSTEVQTYSRFGSLCPYEFLEKWATSLEPTGIYIFPNNSGLVVDDKGVPIVGNVTLPVGQKLDRFGGENGTFLSPLGAPYIERSLPPSNLNTFVSEFQFNYHVYEVTAPLTVRLGPIASWFEQPGMGTQFSIFKNVSSLVDDGFLRRLNMTEYDEPEEFADDYTPGPKGT